VTAVEPLSVRREVLAPRGLIGDGPLIAIEQEQPRIRRDPGFPVVWLIAPATLWLMAFLLLPLLAILIFSFWKASGHGLTPAFTLENYQNFFAVEGFFDPQHENFLTPSIFVRTL
jgi:ABC-type spermidine/putrescine transport system permease subunit I